MDSIRAKQIINSPEQIEVLYQGSPVWLETVRDNNTAMAIRLDSTKERIEVPVYMLVEKNPAK